MVQVHRFESTGEAYDSSQCNENIHNGDVLVVASEGVVGILIEAWPVAISDTCGEFHTFNEDEVNWSRIDQVMGGTKDYTASYNVAVEEIGQLQEDMLIRAEHAQERKLG